MNEIGPVDYMIVAFPGNEFKGEIVAFEMSDLDPEVREGFEKAGVEVNGLFNEDDLMTAGEELEPNTSAALLVWENVWARDVAQKMRDAGGVLLDFERLPHEVVQAAREAVVANA